VVDSVHINSKSKIFLQLFHCGRVKLNDLDKYPAYSSSNIAVRGTIKTSKGEIRYPEPREMSEEDIIKCLNDFKNSAKLAKEAGFDGVELHGANGYLIDQFLRDCCNKRKDKYGGSIENRCRFPLMVIDELINVFGNERVGIKLSPITRFNDMMDSNPIELYKHFLIELNNRNIMFVEFVEPSINYKGLYNVSEDEQIKEVCKAFRPYFKGIIIANFGFDFNLGSKIIENGYADMVSFGKLFISNPDLTERFENNWGVIEPDRKTFYSGGEKGYTDYFRYMNKPNPKF